MPDNKPLRQFLASAVVVCSAVLGCAYLVCAAHAAWRIQIGYGTIYTAIAAGMLSLPWSMLIPSGAQTPLVLSLVTISGGVLNTILAGLVVSRIQQRISGKGVE